MVEPRLEYRGSAHEPPLEDPERLLLVPRLETAEGPRYLLVRWPDWPPPALLAIASPHESDSLVEAVTDALVARLGLQPAGPPQLGGLRVPVRMRHPRAGSETAGWLRPVAMLVSGEPAPDPLIAEVVALSLEEALAQLPTEVERRVLREGASLLGDG